MNHGFVKVATAVPQVRVADCRFNGEQIASLIRQADAAGVEIVVFPELSLTAYSCQDLFQQTLLLDEAEQALARLLAETRSTDIISLVGMPVRYGCVLLNCAVVLQQGRIMGVVPKTFLPGFLCSRLLLAITGPGRKLCSSKGEGAWSPS